jgi:hypothetical protein
MFHQHSYFYYITIGLDVICILHSMRNGTHNKWMLLIVFAPIVGALVYLFAEVFTRRTRTGLQDGIAGILTTNSTRIRKLEENLKFTDTFNNRILLADAYLAAGHTDSAIELYESSLTGAFEENEHVLRQLVIAWYSKGEYARIQPLVKKIYNKPQFARSRAHIYYAISLEKTGNIAQAEQEFKKMKGRFSHFEARLQYGLFLKRTGREQEAQQIFMDIVEEAPHLSSRERRSGRAWIAQARNELNVRQTGSSKS